MKKYQTFVRQPRTKPLSARDEVENSGIAAPAQVPKPITSPKVDAAGSSAPAPVPIPKREELAESTGKTSAPHGGNELKRSGGYKTRVYRHPKARPVVQVTSATSVSTQAMEADVKKEESVPEKEVAAVALNVTVPVANKENHPDVQGQAQGNPRSLFRSSGSGFRGGLSRQPRRNNIRTVYPTPAQDPKTQPQQVAVTPGKDHEENAQPIVAAAASVSEPKVVNKGKQSKPKKQSEPIVTSTAVASLPAPATTSAPVAQKIAPKPLNLSFGRSDHNGGMELVRKPQNDWDTIVRRLHPRFMGPREFEKFEDIKLRDGLLQGLKDYGIESPSECQRKMLKPIISGRDLICQAQSGTGKTVAYTIGILNRISLHNRHTQVLILATTRELAEQIVDLVKAFGKHLKGLTVKACIGGTDFTEEADKLHDEGAHVIVGTVGRVSMLMLTKDFMARGVRTLVLDEGDKMITDISFRYALRAIMIRIPGNTQVILTSATMAPEALRMTLGVMHSPEVFLVSKEQLGRESVKQFYVSCETPEIMMDNLVQVLKPLDTWCKSAIIFCNTREDAKEIKAKLDGNLDGPKIGIMEGTVPQEDRLQTLREFRAGTCHYIISTDVLGRGIDVQNVQLVVNVGMPYNKHEYLHRIGRTGRFGRKGVAVTFVMDTHMTKIRRIEEYYGIKIQPLPKTGEWLRMFGAPVEDEEEDADCDESQEDAAEKTIEVDGPATPQQKQEAEPERSKTV